MSGPERADDSRNLEPRPAFLGKLREAVRLEVGTAPDVVPWNGAGRAEPAPDASPRAERPLPAIRGIEIQHEIGRGGMGTIYRARQIGLDRLVALKLVWMGRGDTAENALSLAKGPRAIAALAHPNIVQIFQVGKQDGWAYGLFEYLDGGDLKGALKDGPWRSERAATLLRTLAETALFIHRRGFVHCDLKCSNVLLSSRGTAKIADFGLVKLLEDGDAVLQKSGTILGTPHAMAPEQAVGDRSAIGPPTDIHALGAILYELLTGRPPFRGPTREETLRQVVEMVPVAPSRSRAEVPEALDEICRRCLQKEPSRRYADAGELAGELSRFLGEAGPTRTRHHRRAVRANEKEQTGTLPLSVVDPGQLLDEAERELYLVRLALAERELERGRPEAARAVLTACAPGPGRPDLRDASWSELRERCDRDR